MTDVNGHVSCTYNYTPFGKVSSNGADSGNRISWSGEYFDNELDCTCYLFRHYDGNIGRWCSLDPLVDLLPMSQYKFVANNPITSFDVNGLLSKGECEKLKNKAMQSDSFKRLIKFLDEHKCTQRKITCECCKGNDMAFHEKIRDVDYISICLNNNAVNEQTMMWLVDHETIHAVQDCGKKNPNTCDTLFCREMEAYYHSKCKNSPPIQRKGCAQHSAKESSEKLCHWGKLQTNDFYKKANAVFDGCVNANKNLFQEN